MKLAFYILAALLAAAWGISFFIFKTGMLTHVLMMTSLLFLMQAIIISPKRRRIVDTENAL